MNPFAHFKAVLDAALDTLAANGTLPSGLDVSKVVVEPPRDPAHGDITTNAAMVLAKPAGMPPRDIAAALCEALKAHDDVAAAEIAGPGFVNMRISAAFWPGFIRAVLSAGEGFARSTMGEGHKVNVEYVSANPTGPLHVGHCRGAVFGDALANLLAFTGHEVTREYYINDAGSQIDVLAQSVLLRYREALGEMIGDIPSGLYPGDYLVPVGKALAEEFGGGLLDKSEAECLALIKERAIDAMMAMIREDLAALNIRQEVFFSEKSLHDSGQIRKTVEKMREQGLVYEGRIPPPKGQLPEDWEDREQTLFRATDYGDDIDRPLMKSDGSYTYFAADVAYARNKIERGFDELVYVLGADHGGYVKRLQAVARALSGGRVRADALLCQLVKLYRGGEPFKMSKRAGDFVTLRDVVDEVGSDVVRFMMLTRKNDAPLDFDFQKVTEQSRDNPVWYVQYAHARIGSAFARAGEEFGPDVLENLDILDDSTLELLGDETEQRLLQLMAGWPRAVEMAAHNREPHRLAFYLYDIAAEFHSYYNKGKDQPQLRFILPNQVHLTRARLALLQMIRYALASGLHILGVRPVHEM
ncbi:MAG: arginine--tRNA ligase [Anderseniella sp.]|jgi:arginyl-tRNA synthetase|nr:arginine--tRNA ligase [Anderseniella sp.]